MISHFLAGGTLLRTQPSRLPQTFRRYKSITAAIERGRQDGPDRPSKPRTYAAPRSSRFGRVGPPRSRDRLPSRYEVKKSEGEDQPVLGRSEREETSDHRSEYREQREDRYSRSGERTPRRKGGFETRERRPGEILKPHWHMRGTGAQRLGEDRERKPYGDRERKPFGDRQMKPYGDRETESYGDRERMSYKARERKSYEDQERKPYGDRDRRPYGDGERKPYAYGEKKPFARISSDEQHYLPPGTVRDPTKTGMRSLDYKREVESLPYTTAASEFIYGFSSVIAAMKASRRKLYKIYVHSRGTSRDGLLTRIRALKLFSITQEVGDEYIRAMDKASSGRPHNGVILETSPLPVLPITQLKTASIQDASFTVGVGIQSAEDLLVNGNQELYSYKADGWRHPLVLYVDGVLDEGNLGAIARSAYFLGVDAIITPTRQVAPWSHIAVKASAGAAEAIPIFKISEPTDFLGKSARAGWRIYASDSIPPPSSTDPAVEDESSSNIIYSIPRSSKRLPADHSPVAESPTILMMGAEGAGLRDSLLNLAHYKVGIRQGREVDEVGVDSLNVSVAASLLCYEMLQKRKAKPAPSPEEVLF